MPEQTILTKEQLEPLGFEEQIPNRFVLHARSTELVYNNGLLLFQGMPLLPIESLEHLNEVLAAFRMTPAPE